MSSTPSHGKRPFGPCTTFEFQFVDLFTLEPLQLDLCKQTLAFMQLQCHWPCGLKNANQQPS
jgi:hypothetical protein